MYIQNFCTYSKLESKTFCLVLELEMWRNRSTVVLLYTATSGITWRPPGMSFLFGVVTKEYIERRHGEPFKFLFLPKMGLLGSQAVLEKKVQFWIMSNFLAPFFQLFMGKKIFFKFFFTLQRSH